MMKDMLKAFYRATKHKPERIIFYRDGVSEGQFMEVRNREVREMASAVVCPRSGLISVL